MLTVVTGPPCSGKSTYVREHANPGDIVVDFDTIAQALGSPKPHDHTGPVRHVTVMARRAAISAALTVAHQVPVWIVATTLSAQDMASYRKAGAVFVRTAADKAELHRRAGRERPALWHQLIDRWRPGPGLDDALGSRDW
jgi:hypothetical protein